MKTIKVKAAGASLHFTLEDSQGMKNPRGFSVLKDKLTVIPMDYAKSMYNSMGVVKWIEDGKLIITQGKEELEDKALEDQYILEPVKATNQAEILNIIKGNNMTKIKEIFSGKNKELALELAGQHSDQLTQTVIGYIEDEVGISLAND